MSGTTITNSQKHTNWTSVGEGAVQLTKDTSTEDATNTLKQVAAKLKDKGGTLAIWNSNNDKNADGTEAKFVRKWFVSSQRKERTAEVVKNLFEKSCDRLTHNPTRDIFMQKVTDYLADGNKALKGNALHELVVKLEEIVSTQAASSAPVSGRISTAETEHLRLTPNEHSHVSSYLGNEPMGFDGLENFEQLTHVNAAHDHDYNEVHSRMQSMQNDILQPYRGDDATIGNRIFGREADSVLERELQQVKKAQQEEQNQAVIDKFERLYGEQVQGVKNLEKQVQLFDKGIDSLIESLDNAKEGFQNTPETHQELDLAYRAVAQRRDGLIELQAAIADNVKAMRDLATQLDSEEWQNMTDDTDEFFKEGIEGELEDLNNHAIDVQNLLKKLNIPAPDLNQLREELTRDSQVVRKELEFDMIGIDKNLSTVRVNAVQDARKSAIAELDQDALNKANSDAVALINGNGTFPPLDDLIGKIQGIKDRLNEHMQWLSARGFETTEAMQDTRRLMTYAEEDLGARITAFANAADAVRMPMD